MKEWLQPHKVKLQDKASFELNKALNSLTNDSWDIFTEQVGI